MQSVRPEPLLSEEDYGAIEAAVMETSRGRWFLAEFARRNRNADTEAVLAAIRRLERLVKSAGTFEAQDEVTRGMADIAEAIAAAQGLPAPDPDTSAQAAIEHAPGNAEIQHPEEPAAPTELGTVEAATVPAQGHAIATAEPAEEIAVTGPGPQESPELQAVHEIFDELETFLVPARPDVQPGEPQAMIVVPEEQVPATGTEPFEIIELDEEATEALLTQDTPRHELILPGNHVAAQRWATEFEREPLDAGVVKPIAEEPLDSGLVTFIDEEPAEASESVFTAPLRLEPEGAESEMAPAQKLPAMTLTEIETMPFAKKAALFS